MWSGARESEVWSEVGSGARESEVWSMRWHGYQVVLISHSKRESRDEQEEIITVSTFDF